MYVANRAFMADGKPYKPGDIIPAETAEKWKTLRDLISMGWIKCLPDSSEHLAGRQGPPVQIQIKEQAEEKPQDNVIEQAEELMKLSVSKLETAIKKVNDKAVLEYIIGHDSRKSAKELAENRLKALDEGE